MDNFFDNQRILEIIWKRRVHFVIIGIIAVLLSAVFSGPIFIRPKYKSVARLYPTNTLQLSNESETEQMIEVLNSNDIKFKMFEVFHLSDVYEISKEDPNFITYMLDRYDENVSVNKTEFETAEIKVLDYEPQRASDMCDSIIKFYNKKVRSLYKTSDKEMVVITQNQLKKRYKELSAVEKQLDSLRTATGIISFKEQVPELTRGYMTALANGRGNAPDTKKIDQLYNNFSKEGAKAELLEARYNRTLLVIDSLTILHDMHLSEYEKNITHCQVVQSPFPADKKSYPVRWLIVLLSTVSAVFLGLLVFLVLDYRKE
ncbi:Wzz/FepE/Etk N-terminal domain-containing protein [Maribellus sp. YY47]|uniref:Wzz/FepE/Etk N-terminal domain-containing protein n=1 Tax=Maribellus sp. YY47 TaxID=2929486 RepID=UPI0020007F82|nr:Wzz/FepE/Etk N-terminal domain-containing protein [Maribellus sp. YY47]MCK3685684.1 Wzz/FepE/Etk N-terminal domain-containing protein [Maribellus sp. YY47]